MGLEDEVVLERLGKWQASELIEQAHSQGAYAGQGSSGCLKFIGYGFLIFLGFGAISALLRPPEQSQPVARESRPVIPQTPTPSITPAQTPAAISSPVASPPAAPQPSIAPTITPPVKAEPGYAYLLRRVVVVKDTGLTAIEAGRKVKILTSASGKAQVTDGVTTTEVKQADLSQYPAE